MDVFSHKRLNSNYQLYDIRYNLRDVHFISLYPLETCICGLIFTVFMSFYQCVYGTKVSDFITGRVAHLERHKAPFVLVVCVRPKNDGI